MAFDFPNSPSVGQRVTGVGGIVYVWDGVKWASNIGSVTAQSMGDVGRNLLHNPLFNVAQRGAGPFTTSNALTADRWRMLFNGTGQVTIFPNASAATIGDEAATHQLNYQFTGTAGAGDLTILIQNIEGVQRISGKTVTVSFWASTGAGTLKLGVNFYQNFGSGGSPSAGVQSNGQSVTLSTAYARYSLTFAIPSAIGKTLGTNGDDNTQFAFWYSAGTSNAAPSGSVGVQSGTIALWGIQLEIGSVATPLEKPDPRYDLSNCQRFLIAYSGTIINSFNSWANGAGNAMTLTFPVTMRATPSVLSQGSISGTVNLSASTLINSSPHGFQWQIVAAGAGAATQTIAGYLASADL